jgi:GNAT superfamily N-acetyltransferase
VSEPSYRIVELGSATEESSLQDWLQRSETLHRQLRPAIPQPYAGHIREMMAEGAQMALLADDTGLRALAVWRVYLSTYAGRRFYVDDLVVDESVRARGWGGKLLAWLEQKARDRQCHTFALDSGTQRHQAHRFYFRAGLVVSSFAFHKPLGACSAMKGRPPQRS